MSGAWPQTRRAAASDTPATDKLRLELTSSAARNRHHHRAIHRSGHLGQFQTSLLQTAARNTSVQPRCKRLWLQSGARLKVRELQRLGARLRDGVHTAFPNAGVPGAVDGPPLIPSSALGSLAGAISLFAQSGAPRGELCAARPIDHGPRCLGRAPMRLSRRGTAVRSRAGIRRS
jgi:hypothetical protein